MHLLIPHTIRIHVPNARHVSIVGDFNNWHSAAHPLVEVSPGYWERIVDLSPGKHRYAFFVIDDVTQTEGALRSRIVANGSVLWVPETLDEGLSITAHPALAIGGHDPIHGRLVA